MPGPNTTKKALCCEVAVANNLEPHLRFVHPFTEKLLGSCLEVLVYA